MKFNLKLCFYLILFVSTQNIWAKEKMASVSDTIPSKILSGLKLRCIGPAFTSGRIADIVVNPSNPSEYYVGVACGNIWKTTNSGTTFEPVFENYGSYSIGCLAMDPNNSNVIWAGTGENNHQRALGYGDGVYKSVDGGKKWKNMGLKQSFQIGMIAIDRSNSDIVYVAAEGSAWGPGGDRGLYKTTDGGNTSERILNISSHTGINNVILHPKDPQVIFATSEQRRRRVNTKIGGGPETALYKSVDGGKNFRKITSGLPKSHLGGMGMAISPANSDVMYLIIEGQNDASNKNTGGFFRSTDRGESWTKMSSHSSSGQYYNEIFCDPVDVDKVYSVETFTHVTEDGGKTFKKISSKYRHVDDHAMWINPKNTQHLLIGGDGGIYESFDGAKTFQFRNNFPVTQFYRVAVDNDYPFYNVYGGTQDNNTLGGPSRTFSSMGITNEDWYATLGGDGFWPGIDPENPNIVYSEYQYGNLYRIDLETGDKQYIKPMPVEGENTFKWNWNTPFIISPHSNTRLYIAANKVFRSEDRGNSWKAISGDLTAQIDRNKWPVMDRYWSSDAVAKDVSTSQYGTIVSMDESDIKEDLVYIGTDDGLIQVTTDAQNWIKCASFSGVPQHTYVSDIKASIHNENVVYAAFDNRKRNDFKPYLLKSTDQGKTWKSITANLPKNGSVHCIEQDHINSELLFVGTEFGLFVSINGGKSWNQLKSGIPTSAIRDIEIQRRENDLVVGTFGRSIFILDDYSPLRTLSTELLKKEAHLFPVKDALLFMQERGKYGQGDDFYFTKNPAYGAVFTYYLKETPKTLRQIRFKEENDLFKQKAKIPQPDRQRLRKEQLEDKPSVLFTIKDKQGNIVRKFKSPAKEGVNRTTWNLRYNDISPVMLDKDIKPDKKDDMGGLRAIPGDYSVSMSLIHSNQVTKLVENVEFKVEPLKNTNLPVEDPVELKKYQTELSKLALEVNTIKKYLNDQQHKLKYIKQAVILSQEGEEIIEEVYNITQQLDNLQYRLYGTKPKASPEEVPPEDVSISMRLGYLMTRSWSTMGEITDTERTSLTILKQQVPEAKSEIKEIGEVKLKKIESELDRLNSGYTPGRIPN